MNESADWGKEDEINISPDNIEVNFLNTILALDNAFVDQAQTCKLSDFP